MLQALGIGECTARGELLPRRTPWFYDNGAFRDWTAGKRFRADKFLRDCDRIMCNRLEPDFLVVPDKVAGGVDSLYESLSWVPRLYGVAPLYIAVQDGMTAADVAPYMRHFDGVFVGGELPWKMQTAASWREFAHARGKPVHVGRVGNIRRLTWARLEVRADSVDSSFPLWHRTRLDKFVKAVRGTERQGWMFA